MRIVSLVPSWTEYLADLGAADEIVGVTKFCVRTPGLTHHPMIVGGTKSFHVDRIQKLKPDIIIVSKEENTKELVEECSSFCEVLITDVRNVRMAFEALVDVAHAIGRQRVGIDWRQRIESAWEAPRKHKCRAVYAVWKEPWMIAGPNTYINDVMNWWGIANACPKDLPGRYPVLPIHEWQSIACNHALLPSEPFPFKESHLSIFNDWPMNPCLVDGEAFSWYGSRMLHSAPYLKALSNQLVNTDS